MSWQQEYCLLLYFFPVTINDGQICLCMLFDSMCKFPRNSTILLLPQCPSLLGKDNNGQGGDFVDEELNRRTKALLPPLKALRQLV